MAVRGEAGIAAAWGFAEATVFFIVPDVWLTYLAVGRGRRPALRAVLPALVGAVAGGALMYGWAVHDQAQVTAVIGALPGISEALIDRVGSDLQAHGAPATVLGAFQGIPYKIYATQAAAGGLGFVGFVLISIPARGLRFLLVALLAAGIARLLERWSTPARLGLLTGFWVIFYALYFWLMQ